MWFAKWFAFSPYRNPGRILRPRTWAAALAAAVLSAGVEVLLAGGVRHPARAVRPAPPHPAPALTAPVAVYGGTALRRVIWAGTVVYIPAGSALSRGRSPYRWWSALGATTAVSLSVYTRLPEPGLLTRPLALTRLVAGSAVTVCRLGPGAAAYADRPPGSHIYGAVRVLDGRVYNLTLLAPPGSTGLADWLLGHWTLPGGRLLLPAGSRVPAP
ncbi:protein of unknown function [Candidatus Hydrogenisulfobacillus filiaventi]|uniref:Uncharacterized protein n=1 Tax=Candidatus Hydrogenisulfobacillus filiaventi TaxID=2707344 RepID=A0A6F8ZJH5_9FIRM|nr:hypothetical protein [Bacillota bacterium]CAB1130031.1 protein of unknown function [Candidatus Hydrogenisulfobacillus filiaventi]